MEQHQTTRDFYNRISGVYDAISHASEAQYTEAGIEALDPGADERVLEVGFGTGHALVALARRARRIDGVDISDGMVDVAGCRVREAGLDNVRLRRADCPPLPYDDGVFDAVFFSFTLELFDAATLPEVLDEVRRVLRSGGRLGVVCMARPTAGESTSFLERGYQWMHRHFPHIVDCAPIEAATLLEDAGFEVLSDRRESMWTMPVAIVLGQRPEG